MLLRVRCQKGGGTRRVSIVESLDGGEVVQEFPKVGFTSGQRTRVAPNADFSIHIHPVGEQIVRQDVFSFQLSDDKARLF